MTDPASDFVERVDAVNDRLGVLVAREAPPGVLTSPDPPSGERWEAGQVRAHLAEFVPYWLGELALVVERGMAEPAPFGRTKSDPARIAAIERDRRADRLALWTRIAADIAGLRAFLLGLDAGAWEARGRHPTLGEMDLTRIVDEFLVGHLEQHALQLEELLA
ncbi:MAG: DinB family protein [Candidatus Dormibacteria bacterium]